MSIEVIRYPSPVGRTIDVRADNREDLGAACDAVDAALADIKREQPEAWAVMRALEEKKGYCGTATVSHYRGHRVVQLHLPTVVE